MQTHNGVGLSVRVSTPVRAPAAGVLRGAGEGPWNGRWVRLDHGAGVTTLFLHNSQILVEPGQTVEAGDVISLSGDTGLVTGPHLHYQVHIGGEPVHPLLYRPPDDEPAPAAQACS